MASEQNIMNETIVKAVAEAMRVAIQAIAAATAERLQGMAGPKIGGPAMNSQHSTGRWKTSIANMTFRLEVNNILSTYNTSITEHLAIVKNWLERRGYSF